MSLTYREARQRPLTYRPFAGLREQLPERPPVPRTYRYRPTDRRP